MNKEIKFEELIKNLKETIATPNYYVDFKKIYEKIIKEKRNKSLKLLNGLIGSKNIKEDFRNLINKNPEVLEVIPILLAIRKNEILMYDNKIVKKYIFNKKPENIEDFIDFMGETGLFKLLSESKINNLLDYVTGIEVGLDTNARKNRTGKLMEKIVANFIEEINDDSKEVEAQINKKQIAKKYNIDLNNSSILSNDKKSEKIFDFAIKTKEQLYLLEVNFFASAGSKLNETARSFILLSEQLNKINGVTFIWITDGVGWKNAKKNLKEAFNKITHLYNLSDLEKGILKKVIK